MSDAEHASWLDRWLRHGRVDARDIQLDLLYLLGACLLLIATGIGLRDPWPADEPRFALIARDMVASGEWLIPRVGGDLYADKPPLFFWLIAVALSITHSLRWSFLLPSLVSAIGCVVLVYDLARRLWNREVGLLAGMTLLLTVQFVWQARQAQIDATLCFFTTLSCYGLLRHLLLGPQWRWYAIAWFAAGLGVITKGVGFLPLLLLLPYAVLRTRGWGSAVQFGSRAVWLIGPAMFVIAVSIWLVPMLTAAQSNPEIAVYRDEILFNQTVNRYVNAWHHHEPFYYFIVNVIPGLWLPLTLLLPWLLPRWKSAWQSRDLRVVLPLLWMVIVVLFFSASAGKRGVYVLPAVPAFVLAAAPYLREILHLRTAQTATFALPSLLVLITVGAWVYLVVNERAAIELRAIYELDATEPLIVIAAATLIACLAGRRGRAPLVFAASIASTLLVVSFWINPAINDARSGESFIHRVMYAARSDKELAFSGFKEQYLLHIHRPVVHFGHARWREAEQETADAARWLAASSDRQLVVTRDDRELCFQDAVAYALGIANREEWFIVNGKADPKCVVRGNPDVVQRYVPRGPSPGR